MWCRHWSQQECCRSGPQASVEFAWPPGPCVGCAPQTPACIGELVNLKCLVREWMNGCLSQESALQLSRVDRALPQGSWNRLRKRMSHNINKLFFIKEQSCLKEKGLLSAYPNFIVIFKLILQYLKGIGPFLQIPEKHCSTSKLCYVYVTFQLVSLMRDCVLHGPVNKTQLISPIKLGNKHLNSVPLLLVGSPDLLPCGQSCLNSSPLLNQLPWSSRRGCLDVLQLQLSHGLFLV